jgi:hypothetical protein
MADVIPQHDDAFIMAPLLHLSEMTLLAVTVAGGEFGVTVDLETQIVYGALNDDDGDGMETLFWLKMICPHCKEIHHVGMVWHPNYGLFIVDNGNMIFEGIPTYDTFALFQKPAWRKPRKKGALDD